MVSSSMVSGALVGSVGADRGAHRPRGAEAVGLLFRNLHLLREVKIVKLCHAYNLHALTSTDYIFSFGVHVVNMVLCLTLNLSRTGHDRKASWHGAS